MDGMGGMLYVSGRQRMMAISAVKPGIAPMIMPASRPTAIATKLSKEAIIESPVRIFSNMVSLLYGSDTLIAWNAK